MPFNQAWVQNASALLFILSDTLIAAPGSEDFKPSHSYSFDAGAAWALLALQATRMGYHSHSLPGVDFHKARAELGVQVRFRIQAAVSFCLLADQVFLYKHRH